MKSCGYNIFIQVGCLNNTSIIKICYLSYNFEIHNHNENNLTKFEKFTELGDGLLRRIWTELACSSWWILSECTFSTFIVSVTQCLWHLSREVLCYSITGDRETRRSRLEHGYNKKDLIILQLLMSIIYIMAHEAYKVDIISIQV